MSELKEKDSDTTVRNDLIPEEVEMLREMGVEVEQSHEDQEGSGSGDGVGDDEEQEEGGSGGDGDEEQEEEEQGDDGDGSGNEEGDEQESDGGESGDGEDQDDATPDNSGLDEGDLDELEQESEAAGDKEEMIDADVDEQVDAVKQAGGGDGSVEIDCFERPNRDRVRQEWVTTADLYASQLGKTLVDHFRQERKTATKKNQRSGTFDSDQMISADRGSAKVFKSHDKPDEKKYHAVICLDDSGSMSGRPQKGANIAAAMLTSALEEAGVETTVYRYASRVRLVKNAAQDYEQVKGQIIENDCNGGTCLLPALEQAEEISETAADETFLVNITDGCPRDVEGVKEKLDTQKMKSITLQIKDDRDTFRGDYDGFVYVDDVDEIPSKAKSAFRRVML